MRVITDFGTSHVFDARRGGGGKWDPNKHPRDKEGKFGHGNGASKTGDKTRDAMQDPALKEAHDALLEEGWVVSKTSRYKEKEYKTWGRQDPDILSGKKKPDLSLEGMLKRPAKGETAHFVVQEVKYKPIGGITGVTYTKAGTKDVVRIRSSSSNAQEFHAGVHAKSFSHTAGYATLERNGKTYSMNFNPENSPVKYSHEKSIKGQIKAMLAERG